MDGGFVAGAAWVLSQAEGWLATCIADGDIADFHHHTPDTRPVIRAAVLRRLLLGLPVALTTGATPAAVPTPAGVRASHFDLDAALDLDDATGPSGRLPPLVLVDVRMPALSARHAHLARVVLDDCRVNKIDLTGAVIGGDVDLSRLRAYHDNADCWVTARGCRIDGTLTMAEAKLKLTPRQNLPASADKRYALDLFEADITGTALLMPGFVADGGLNITNATLGGDLELNGARLVNGEGVALYGQRCQIGVGAWFNVRDGVRFEAIGTVHLSGARIGGQLVMNGASLSNPGGDALNAQSAEIEGDAFFNMAGDHRFTAAGEVSLSGARIGGQLSMNGASLSKPINKSNPNGFALIADGAEIRGDAFFNVAGGHRFTATGQVRLSGARIGGQLVMSGASLSNPPSESDPKGTAFNAQGAAIEGGAFFNVAGDYRFSAAGQVRLSSTRISGQLVMNGASLSNPKGTALNAQGAAIKEDAFFDVAGGHRFSAAGQVSLAGARIGGQLSMQGAGLSNRRSGSNPHGIALNAHSAEIKDGIFFRDSHPLFGDSFEANGIVEFTNARLNHLLAEGAQLGDGIRLNNTQVSGDVKLHSRLVGAADFVGARIGGELSLGLEIVAGRDGELNLTDCRAERLTVKRITFVEPETPKKPATDETAAPSSPQVSSSGLSRGPRVPEPGTVPSGTLGPGHKAQDDSGGAVAPAGQSQQGQSQQGMSQPGQPAASTEPPEPLSRELTVNLTRARVGVLDDDHAQGWGKSTLMVLDGFEYQHIAGYVPVQDDTKIEFHTDKMMAGAKPADVITVTRTKTETGKARRAWLNQQFAPGKPPTTLTYFPQPYEQLARVLQAQGSVDDAQLVLREKARIEGSIKRRPWNWIYRALFGVPFGYGFAPWSAVGTFGLFVLIGTVSTMYAQHAGLLVIDTQPVANVVLMKAVRNKAGESQFVFDSTATDTRRPVDATGPAPKTMTDLPCLDEITSWVYALDLAVPLLDLHEETRCTIRAAKDTEHVFESVGGFLTHPTVWRWGKGLYAVLGWILSSLTVLTVAGVFKRLAERK